MIEWLAPGFLYSLFKDIWSLASGHNQKVPPKTILEQREKWRPLFEKEIINNHRNNLRQDIIIHNVTRMADYPKIDKKEKGISAWFRCALLGTYHGGALVGLRFGELKKHLQDDQLRYVDYKNGEAKDFDVILVARIPYYNIVNVNWDGDEFYGFPHIYVKFNRKTGEPYETKAYCLEKTGTGGVPFYVEIAQVEAVRRLSKKLNIPSSV